MSSASPFPAILILLLFAAPASAQPAPPASPKVAPTAPTTTASSAATRAAPTAPTAPTTKAGPPGFALSFSWPDKLDPGQVELRPYPSPRQAAALFLRGDEAPATRSVAVGGTAPREARLEAPLGFWLLSYADASGRRLEAALEPLATPLELGEMTLAAIPSELRVVGSRGAPVAGALVAFRPTGPGRSGWRPATERLVAGPDGRVSLPRPETRGELWILAPGFRPFVALFGPDELPRTIALTSAVTRPLQVVDRLRRPLADALISSSDGLPLGFTSAAGELSGSFEEDDALWIEDTAGRRFRATVATFGKGRLRLQVGSPLAYTGEVVDRRPPGRPLPDALVWIAGHPETWRRADGEGRFSLGGPPDDRSLAPQVEALAPGYSRGSLPAGPAELVLALEPADRILSGRVQDAGGEPLAGARIEVSDRDRRFSFTATTGEDGAYRLTGLPSSPLWARVSKATYLPAKEPLNPAFAELRRDFTLEAGRLLVGQLVGSRGQPIAGGEVALAGASSNEPDEPLGLTDREGRFELGTLEPGRHLLVFTAPGLVRLELPVELPAAEDDLDLGAIEMAEQESFGGRVVDEDGEPLEGAAVFAWRGEEGRELLLEWPTWRRPDATSGADGKFDLPGLAAGESIGVEIRAPGRPPIFAKNVAVVAGEGPDFVVPRGAALEVEVLGSGREPLAGAAITLVRLGVDQFENFQLTDRDGRAVYPALPAGPLELRIESRDYGVYRRQLELERGENASVQVVLGEDGTVLDGRVFLPDGLPATGFTVFVDTGDRTTPPPAFTRVDEAGFYHLEGLPTGTVAVEVSGTGKYAPIYRRRVSLEGAQNQLDIDLPEASVREIAVRVVAEDGQPLEGVGVTIYYKRRKGGIISLSRRSDGDGLALFSRMPAATYEIMVWAPDPSWRSGEARLKLDQPRKEIEVALVRIPGQPALE